MAESPKILRAADPFGVAASVLSKLGADGDDLSTDPPVVAGYGVERPLGRGGSGQTFLAHQLSTGARVALKVFHQPLGDGAARARNERELHVLEQLHLHCVPRLRGSGTTGSHLYIATDFVEGQRLDEARPPRREPLARDELLARVALLARIADAVQQIHERGLIHRDLKPSNVIVDPSGDPVIIDLGIATLQALDSFETITADGAPIGTPAFMAPEQARGERGAVSTRIDVYALGAIGRWLCTGEPPHDLAGATLHEAIRRVGSTPARPLPAWIDRDLGAVLGRMTDRDVAARYDSAGAAAEDLRRWARGERVLAKPPGPWRRFGDAVGAHPLLTATCLGAVIVLAAVSAAAIVIRVSLQRPYRIELGGGGRAATLFTIAGEPIRAWDGREEYRFELAELLELPAALGGGRGVLLATQSESHGAKISLYRHPGYERAAVEFERPPRVHPRLEHTLPGESGATSFNLLSASLSDVIPGSETPGNELVAVYGNTPGSSACVRVYALDGSLLFEAWHDGHLLTSLWMPEPGLLVLAGCNSDGTWTERGGERRLHSYPPVVLAVRPRLGLTDAVVAWPGFAGDLEPEWMYAVLPDAVSDFVAPGGLSLALARQTEDPATHIQFQIQADTARPNAHAAMSFLLHASGRVVDSYPTPAWEADPALPRPQDVMLGEVPVRRSRRGTPGS